MVHVLNRTTGAVLWTAQASYGFFNNSVVAGNGKLFVIDRINWDQKQTLEARMKWNATTNKPGSQTPGAAPDDTFKQAKLTAYAIATGQKVWEHTDKDAQLFGTWLAYSEKYDILLECQAPARLLGRRRSSHGGLEGRDGKLRLEPTGPRLLGRPGHAERPDGHHPERQ